MKYSIRCLTTFCAITAGVSALRAADEKKSTPKEEKKELRVITTTEPEKRTERRVVVGRVGEKEKVTFLGVETSTVSGTLAAQLGLAKGSGLVVNHVVPDSPAAGALQDHDVLLRFDDQILIEVRQLSVLIRNKKEGDEVTLTFLRAGKQQTAKVKLGTKEVPKLMSLFEQKVPLGGNEFVFAPRAANGRFEMLAPEPGVDQEHVDRVLSLIRPGAGPDPVRIQIDRSGGPGFRSTRINTANSNLVYSDDDGSLELSVKDGQKTLVAKDAKGQSLFSGPVTTPEQRKAMPEGVRGRLEKLEGMHDITFRTDGSFHGAEAKVLQPTPRSIALPAPMPVRRPALFF
jgi:serine protease Do